MFFEKECKRRHVHFLILWREKQAAVARDSKEYISRLLDTDVFSTVRRIYRSSQKSIPALKLIAGGCCSAYH